MSKLYSAVVALLRDRVDNAMSAEDVDYWGRLMIAVGQEEGDMIRKEFAEIQSRVRVVPTGSGSDE